MLSIPVKARWWALPSCQKNNIVGLWANHTNKHEKIEIGDT